MSEVRRTGGEPQPQDAEGEQPERGPEPQRQRRPEEEHARDLPQQQHDHREHHQPARLERLVGGGHATTRPQLLRGSTRG